MAPSGAKKRSIRQSLSILGIENTTIFESCAATRGDEFKIVRKIYLQLVLKAHPDKGGDPQVFREIQTSFELLRDLHTGKRRGAWLFSECLGGQDGKAAKAKSKQDSNSYDMKDYDTKFDSSEVPSWEHYEEAARQEVPIYSVELAKSGRSKCSQKGKTTKKCSQAPVFVDPRTCYSLIAQPVQPELISKGEIRVGSLLEDTGTYTRWHHLRCWRVPHKVWLGIPDPDKVQDEELFASALARMDEILIMGFVNLPVQDQKRFIRHVMDKSNWARARKQKINNKTPAISSVVATGGVEPMDTGTTSTSADDSKKRDSSALVSTTSSALVKTKERFQVPVPGRNGCLENVFQGQRVVLTGVFPELGGGAGLNLGKARAKAMVASFGGKVASSISGLTKVLLVGKNPGFSKVSNARARNITMMSLHDLKMGLESGAANLDDFEEKPMLIQNFSAGYKSGGLALTATPEDLKVAQGLSPHPDEKKTQLLKIANAEEDSKPPAKNKKKKKKKPTGDQKAEPKKENSELPHPDAENMPHNSDSRTLELALNPRETKRPRRSARLGKKAGTIDVQPDDARNGGIES